MVRRRGLIALALIVLVGGLFAWRFMTRTERAEAQAEPVAPVIPVTPGTAVLRDVPIYLRALGTVQAYYTVTVRTRVDGQIMQVFYREGQEVKAGAPLLQIDPRPFQATLEQAEAMLQRDTAQLQGAQTDLKRYAGLVGPGYQTKQAYDDQKALVAQLQGTVKADQAQIDAAKLNLTYADVRSPTDGRVGARLVDPGNFVQATQGTALVTITKIKPIFVDFSVPQDEIAEIRAREASGPLAVLAYASDDKTLLSQGTLTLVNNQVDTTSGTIELKGTFANADERLWPGEFVNARLVLGEHKKAVTVPARTVMQGPNGGYAYVIKPDGTVERRSVEVAMTENGQTVITKGIAAGERVVVDGQYRLTNGAKVRLLTSDAGASPAPRGQNG